MPKPPVTVLKSVDGEKKTFDIDTAPQTREDLDISGKVTSIPFKPNGWRQPLVVFIDDVLDPGNLGAIIRSAYFLGVDAIALSARNCAPITPTALKASAGAAEAIPLLFVENPQSFLESSASSGWNIYCATTPRTTEQPLARQGDFRATSIIALNEGISTQLPQQIQYTRARNGKSLPRNHCPVTNGPTILVVGGEGKGLKSSLTKHAWAYVEILPKINVDEIGVDSLNVSVATALLCAEFLRPEVR